MRRPTSVYIADGLRQPARDRFDSETGAYKRALGRLRPPARRLHPVASDAVRVEADRSEAAVLLGWRTPVRIDKDGLVYVGDRNNSRIQVFKKDGTYIKEAYVAPNTVRGSVLDFVFSKDPRTAVRVRRRRAQRARVDPAPPRPARDGRVRLR